MGIRIAWISSPGLIDTDIYITPILSKLYDVDWYIIRREKRKLDFEKEIDDLRDNCQIIDYDIGKRLRSFKTLVRFYRLAVNLSDLNYDAIYIEFGMMPYFIPIMAHCLDLRKTFIAIHNVHVVNGGNNYFMASAFTKYAIRKFRNFNVFSKNQYDLLREIVPNKNVFYTPFILKDYGDATLPRIDDRITFTSFGNIIEYKRIDVLIKAAESIYEQARGKFRVVIAGNCEEWKKYEKLIVHKEIFDLKIKRIPNEEIPNLFNETDYFVMPYQDIAQSGAMMVAINYNKPIIASRLNAFEENIIDGFNGYFIEPADINDLAEKMMTIISNHKSKFDELVNNQIEFKNNKYSDIKIVEEYKKMFSI